MLSRHVSEEDLSNAGGVADRSRCLARRIQSAAAPSGALVLWQNPDADIRGQCAVGEGENLSGVTLVRTRCLSGEVLSYTAKQRGVLRPDGARRLSSFGDQQKRRPPWGITRYSYA